MLSRFCEKPRLLRKRLISMKRLTGLLLCFLILLTLLPTAYAQTSPPETKVVRVGWYDSAFHHTDRFGRRSGYGYEYQQHVANYTGWKYEYVEGSWSELFEMLAAGDIDLLSDVSYTEARAEQILFSSEAMGSEDYHLFISPSNTEISPDDFSTFNGKRVGVNKNSIQEQLFVEWAGQHNVQPELIELSEKTPELLEMLNRGEIDALVTLDTYGRQADVVPVCKVGFAESFFGISKNRPDLKQELDVAMSRILEDNRNFNQQLTEKFNEASSISSFLTADEISWFSSHGVIRVGYQDDFMPFCGTDKNTQKLIGTLADYLDFAETCEKNAELRFEAIGFNTAEEALQALNAGEIDCLFPVNLRAYDAEKLGVIATDPFIATELYAVVRSMDREGLSREEEELVAVKKGNINYEIFLMDYFPMWQPVGYDDLESGFRALASGEADYALVSNYRLNRVAPLCAEYNLSTLATGENMSMSFAVRRQDNRLYSILNKVSRLLPKTMISSSLARYSLGDNKITFGDFLKDNLTPAVAILAVVVSLILLLLLSNVRTEMKAHKGQQLISEAERDPLTGLYTKSFFFAYANRMTRQYPDTAMDAVVVNIERFRALNRLNGRAVAEEVLRTLGNEIHAFLKENKGIAARLEGDYFYIFCKPVENYQSLLDRFQSGVNEKSSADIRLRMGIMRWQKGLVPETMIDLARSACSKVRGNYKTSLMIYDEEMRKRDQFAQRLQSDFARALQDHQMQVYYQPKYDIQSQPPRLNSAEALVRWQHPELGTISPADFIPLFERSGQISALDIYVWTEAARQIAAWRDRYGVTLPVSVNLSRVDVFDPDLRTVLDRLLAEYHLDCQTLKLEVTESAYTENASQLIQIINGLREKGYEIEMDDFGSGYSSLNMLSSMPIDVLKMDMAFIRNIEHNERDFRLVELILDIARYLNVPVIAEGVETEHQLKLLRDAGCALVQGYYFSRPLPADEFEQKILVPSLKSQITG